MNNNARTVRLKRNELLVVDRNSRIASVRVLDGRIWLTGTPGNEDVLISSSQRYPLSANWPFVLQALTDSDCVLEG